MEQRSCRTFPISFSRKEAQGRALQIKTGQCWWETFGDAWGETDMEGWLETSRRGQRGRHTRCGKETSPGHTVMRRISLSLSLSSISQYSSSYAQSTTSASLWSWPWNKVTCQIQRGLWGRPQCWWPQGTLGERRETTPTGVFWLP